MEKINVRTMITAIIIILSVIGIAASIYSQRPQTANPLPQATYGNLEPASSTGI